MRASVMRQLQKLTLKVMSFCDETCFQFLF